MINKRTTKDYCCEDISLIENYDKAIDDNTQTWECHHRRETIYSRKDLIEIGEYYNRPAIELIFLTPKEHRKIHRPSEEIKKKISEQTKEAMNNPEIKKKISECRKGKKLSEETKRRISESVTGEKNGFYGKTHSEETRRKMREKNIGTHWYNNGITELQVKERPEGFVKGRLKKIN